jgi:long-chain-fatty-acid--CoA ligase ACSBG
MSLSRGKLRESHKTKITDPTDATRIAFEKEGIGAAEPISIPELMNKTVQNYGDHPALNFKNHENKWETITFKQYKAKVDKMAKVFIKLGLEAHHTVAVLAFNSPEWFVSELAAIHAGGIIAGVYTTNSPHSVLHVLQSSRAQIVVVDDAKQMEKIREIKDKLPGLKAVIQTKPPYLIQTSETTKRDGYYRWMELEEMDTDDVEEEYKRRLENIVINETCCLVYTSGTVGNPKGVMLNHDNLTWDSYALGMSFGDLQTGKEVIVSYLPLSHVAAQIVDIFCTLTFAISVYFADKDALKGTLIKTLSVARPTRFLAVPRVYEKIQEKMMSVGSSSGPLKKFVSSWAKNVTLQHHMDKMEGRHTTSFQYKLAKSLIFSKVKSALGFDRCKTMVSAAAPISVDTKKYFMSLDMPLGEAFGMSETSGAHCVAFAVGKYNFETIGKPIQGAQTKILNPDAEGNGEIMIKGRHVFQGYIFEDAKTEEALEDDGWMHTGDVGRIDETGFIYITGRIKELIITAGGENIPPVHIEHLVKSELPHISNAFLVGDKRKFLTMLVSLKTEMDPDTGAPKDELQKDTVKWLESLGLKYTKLSEVLAAGPDKTVLKAIQDGIDRANKSSISNAQKNSKVCHPTS